MLYFIIIFDEKSSKFPKKFNLLNPTRSSCAYLLNVFGGESEQVFSCKLRSATEGTMYELHD